MSEMNIKRLLRCKSLAFMITLLVAGNILHGQFTIAPGGYISIEEGGTMWIGTSLQIESDATASGFLVDRTIDGDITITGDIVVERYMTPDIWHNVASPVSNGNSSSFVGTDIVFYYDETIILNDWNFGWVMYSGPLEVFKGYDLLWFDNPLTVTYNATGAESVNTGTHTIGVTITDVSNGEIPSHKGWNLVGNPYPSPVDWMVSSGWDKDDINDAKYIWDGSNDIYTIFLGGFAPIGINGGTQFIPSNQGFWVQATVTGSMSINNACRVGEMGVTPDYYKDGNIDYPMVSLVASGNSFSDEIIIRFLEGTTGGFDINYDATKLYSSNPEVPQLILNTGESVMALNTLPEITEDLEVQLDFYCGKEGYYTISLSDRSNLDRGMEVYLKDLIEDKIINLGESLYYGFNHKTDNPMDRFRIYFNPTSDIINNINPESYFTIYTYNNTLIVLKNTIKSLNGEITVFNMLGMPVWKGETGNSEKMEKQLDLPPGSYVVRINAGVFTHNTRILLLNH